MDLDTGAEVLLDHGDLESALLASAAIPGILPPVDRDGRTLVDGGLVAHVPVVAAMERRGGERGGAVDRTGELAVAPDQSAPTGWRGRRESRAGLGAPPDRA